MSKTWPLVCNVYSWDLFSIEHVLANFDGFLTVKKDSRLLLTEINNTAQTERKLITGFQHFCLFDLFFFLLDLIWKIFLLQLLILLQQACELFLGIIEREQNPNTNILFRKLFPHIYFTVHCINWQCRLIHSLFHINAKVFI